jgi:hypothetical protein
MATAAQRKAAATKKAEQEAEALQLQQQEEEQMSASVLQGQNAEGQVDDEPTPDAEQEPEEGQQEGEPDQPLSSIFRRGAAPTTIRKARAKKEFNADPDLVDALWDSYNNDEWFTVADNQYGADAKRTVLYIRKHADHLGLGLSAPESGWTNGEVTFKAKQRKSYNS